MMHRRRHRSPIAPRAIMRAHWRGPARVDVPAAECVLRRTMRRRRRRRSWWIPTKRELAKKYSGRLMSKEERRWYVAMDQAFYGILTLPIAGIVGGWRGYRKARRRQKRRKVQRYHMQHWVDYD